MIRTGTGGFEPLSGLRAMRLAKPWSSCRPDIRNNRRHPRIS